MKTKNESNEIMEILKAKYGKPKAMLTHKNPWELLVAVILSAQCTDKRVNMVTPELFNKFKSVFDLANAKEEDVSKIIHSTGFHNVKTRSIIEASKHIAKNWNGELKNSLNELIKLPGVGRKTANVILYNAFGINEGIAVDTHVLRIAFLIGLTKSKHPNEVEGDLMKLVKQKYWGDLTHYFILLGREICIARKPNCRICPLRKICNFGNQFL